MIRKENKVEIQEIKTQIETSDSPGGSVLKNPLAVRETYVRFLGQEEPLEKEMTAHSSILAWKIPWTWRLVGYHPWGCKESDMTEQLHFLSFTLLM